MSMAVPQTLATIDNAAPAMRGVLESVADALKRQSPNGGCRSRAWPVHMSALAVLDVTMKINSRLSRVPFGMPCSINVTLKRPTSAHAANMLKVDQVISWGIKSDGSMTDMASRRMG
jgi:hypothetical protein